MKDRYIIVKTSIGIGDLEEKVNQKIKEGYLPIGTIGIGKYSYFQPMLLEDIKTE